MNSDELRALADAATPGPWKVDRTAESLDVTGEHGVATIWVHLAGAMTMGDDAAREVQDRALTDARLIAALGPDAARLLADAMDTLYYLRDIDWPYLNDPKSPYSLLGRFAFLGDDG